MTNGDELDIRALARIGAELEYTNLMRRQAAITRQFPGVAQKAQLRIRQEQAAHARQFKKRNRRGKVQTPAVAEAADRG
jgi:hypothetical protein